MNSNPAPPTVPARLGILVGIVAITVGAITVVSGVSPFSSATAGSTTIAEPSEARGTVVEADGVLPDGATVFDEQYPGVANLDPALLDALRDAATDAADAGLTLTMNSGWRSAAYQNQLLSEAIAEHGSAEEAARWVATAATSPHVQAAAADLGPSPVTAWLSEHGAEYGLCQIYANEPWHYEFRREAIGSACPRAYPDPTHDPRMQG